MTTNPTASDRPDPVPVPHEIFQGIEAVRLSGLTNMLDRPAVAEIAEAMGFEESARWVREHRDLYARAVFQGFAVEGGDEGA
jgi:hypothetical protein